MKRQTAVLGLAALLMGLSPLAVWAQLGVQPGDPAPLLVSVDQNMRRIDMGEMLDGVPLVLLYGSST